MPSKSWYNSVGSGSGAKLTLSYDSLEVSADGTTAKIIGGTVTFYSKSGWSDSTNKVEVLGGAVVDDVLATNRTYSGGTVTWPVTGQVQTLAATAATYNFTVRVANISFFNGDGSTDDYVLPVSYPAVASSPPNPPTTVTATRQVINGAALYRIAWTSAATASRPWSKVYVERWDNAAGAWYVIAQMAGTATLLSDTSIQANRRYQWRVRAWNSAGYSAYTSSAIMATAPAPPSALSAVRSGGDVVLTWTQPATTDTGATAVEVQDNPGGLGWVTVRSDLPPGTSTWTAAAPDPLVSHVYRVRNVAGELTSAWSGESQTIRVLSRPSPPTDLAPAAEHADASVPLVFTWRHNAADGSPQTAYTLRHRQSGDLLWTVVPYAASGVEAHTLAAGTYPNGVQVEWQVATWGAYTLVEPTGSDWSAQATFTTSGRPTTTIVFPGDGGLVTRDRLTVQWIMYDPESAPQTQYRAWLYSDTGALLEDHAGYTGADSVTFAQVLDDGGAYTVAVQTRDDGQWSDVVEHEFAVVYVGPPVAQITASWTDLGAVAVTIETPDPPNAGVPEAISATLWRSTDLTLWERVAVDIAPDATIMDYTAPIGVTVWYMAATYSDIPSSSWSPPAELVDRPAVTGGVWLTGGPGYSVGAHIMSGIQIEDSDTVDKALHWFAGREAPVEYMGEAVTRTITLSGTIFGARQMAAWESLRAIQRVGGPVCFRTCLGDRLIVSVGPVSRSVDGPIYTSARVTLTVLDPLDVVTMIRPVTIGDWVETPAESGLYTYTGGLVSAGEGLYMPTTPLAAAGLYTIT